MCVCVCVCVYVCVCEREYSLKTYISGRMSFLAASQMKVAPAPSLGSLSAPDQPGTTHTTADYFFNLKLVFTNLNIVLQTHPMLHFRIVF